MKTIKCIFVGEGATWLLWMQNEVAKAVAVGPAIRQPSEHSADGLTQYSKYDNVLGKCHN